MSEKRSSSPKALIWIGAWKLVQGVLLMILASGVLFLLHRDLQQTLTGWIELIRFDPHNKHIASGLRKAGLISTHRLKQLSGLTFIYASLFIVEGIGLILRKRWAEYLTVLATASLLPMEYHEVHKHATPVRIAILVANILIVVYLLVALRRNESAPATKGTQERAGELPKAEAE